MADVKIGIRDRREPGFFTIDNEVYDLGLSCEAMTFYAAISRYAHNGSEKAYFSGKKWKKHHRVGHKKLSDAMRELISKQLIRKTEEKTKVGAVYFELCSVSHLKAKVFYGETGGCSTSEEGGVLPQNTNKTEKTKQKNNTNKSEKATASRHTKKPKDEQAYKDWQDFCRVWLDKTGQDYSVNKPGYYFAARLKHGHERLVRALINYANDEWRKSKRAWNLDKWLSAEVYRYIPAADKVTPVTGSELLSKLPQDLLSWMQILEPAGEYEGTLLFTAKEKVSASFVEQEFRKHNFAIKIVKKQGA